MRGDAQSCRDLFTAFTPGHPYQDVALALGQARTLTSLEVVLELISHTTTNEGLAVTAVKDSKKSSGKEEEGCMADCMDSWRCHYE